MQKIKNIIFDLGGILLNIDFEVAAGNFKKLGVSNFNEFFRQDHVSQLFSDLETGKISTDNFYDAFLSETGIDVDYKQLADAWNSLLLNFPTERIEWLKKLRNQYNLFLFSNTNEIHYKAFIKSFKESTGENFNDYFKKTYYSHQIGLRKPSREAFEYILKEQSLDPSETLFIDDTLANVETAKQLGMQTIHIQPPMTVLGPEVQELLEKNSDNENFQEIRTVT